MDLVLKTKQAAKWLHERPAVSALLLVALTVISVGLLSYSLSSHAAKDARFGPGMHHRFGGMQLAGDCQTGGMPPQGMRQSFSQDGMRQQYGQEAFGQGFSQGMPPQPPENAAPFGQPA